MQIYEANWSVSALTLPLHAIGSLSSSAEFIRCRHLKLNISQTENIISLLDPLPGFFDLVKLYYYFSYHSDLTFSVNWLHLISLLAFPTNLQIPCWLHLLCEISFLCLFTYSSAILQAQFWCLPSSSLDPDSSGVNFPSSFGHMHFSLIWSLFEMFCCVFWRLL